jgi:hypothetical protein
MSERLLERYSRVKSNSSRLEGLYGDLKEVRVMAGNGSDQHDTGAPLLSIVPRESVLLIMTQLAVCSGSAIEQSLNKTQRHHCFHPPTP